MKVEGREKVRGNKRSLIMYLVNDASSSEIWIREVKTFFFVFYIKYRTKDFKINNLGDLTYYYVCWLPPNWYRGKYKFAKTTNLPILIWNIYNVRIMTTSLNFFWCISFSYSLYNYLNLMSLLFFLEMEFRFSTEKTQNVIDKNTVKQPYFKHLTCIQ